MASPRPSGARGSLAAICLVAAVGVSACGVSSDSGLDRARSTIQELAGTIGTRPIGSPEAVRARDYVAAALSQAGFHVRIQDADAVWARRGLTAPVSNVIATRDGPDRTAIALVAHYDSVPDGPGAQDDALGVATCLEAARQLSARALNHSLMVLVTDGEEVGLMGARAIVTDAEVRERVHAFLNFDGTGGTGPPVLFQAGPGRGDTLRAWATGAVAPFGGSFGLEVYKRLPNDTDFTVLAAAGASGLNFAPIGDSYVYHTDHDRPAGVADGTIARQVANTVGIVRALDQTTLAHADDDPTFFDVAQQTGVVFGRTAARWLGLSAIVGGLLAWVLTTRHLLADPTRALGRYALRASLVTLLAVASMTAAIGVLERLRHEPTPWYASPFWTFAALAAIGGLVIWAGGRFGGATPTSRTRPALVWWMALPVWIGLATFLVLTAQAASYLVTIPLLTMSVCVALGGQDRWLRVASGFVALVVWLFWAMNIVVLLSFLVPLFGWLPILTPMWLYPAVIALAGLVLAPPVVAAAAGTRLVERHVRWIGGFWLVVTLVAGTGAATTPAYTADRPARRTVRYFQDDVRHEAWWALAGSDGHLADRLDQPTGAAWAADASLSPAAERAGLFPLPIHLQTLTPVAAQAPADVRARLVREEDGRVTLHVVVDPRALLAARLVLPTGVTPVASSVAGVTSRGQWSAAYVAVPANFEFRVDLAPDLAPNALAGTVVELTLAGVPVHGAFTDGLPDWLPPGPATWQARSVFIEPAAPEGS